MAVNILDIAMVIESVHRRSLWKIYFERMESPATLLRSSKASMTTLPALLVMVTSYLKSTLMSDMGVLCLHCFSILL